MKWLRRDLMLSAVIFGAVLCLVVEGGLLRQVRRQATLALNQLEQGKQERERLQHQAPVPNEENECAILRDLDEARANLAAVEASFVSADDRAWSAQSRPGPIDAYFEIASMIEKARGLAASQRVILRADEHFSFSSHASEGPETELIPGVLRQCTATRFLVNALFEAHPTALLSVQREHPLAMNQPSSRRASMSVPERGDPSDFFVIAPEISVRAPGKIGAEAFRLEFSGQTGMLRSFLNRLASSEKCFVVRSVEVEPIGPAPGKINLTASVSSLTPIVPQTSSRFRVVVELVAPVLALDRSMP